MSKFYGFLSWASGSAAVALLAVALLAADRLAVAADGPIVPVEYASCEGCTTSCPGQSTGTDCKDKDGGNNSDNCSASCACKTTSGQQPNCQPGVSTP